MRLIDADAMLVQLAHKHAHSWGKVERAFGEVAEMLNNAPTVDAVPVRHGEWVGTDFDRYADGNPVYYLWHCSCCHEEHERDGLPPWYDYCPNCGAKMDGGKDDLL